ncbi:hypothetical protein D5278_03140 [bacterium 1XD21-13]|nr:hypothetical protein [bacterium 1XD21-13]
MKRTKKFRTALLILLASSVLLTGCAYGNRELSYHDNTPKICGQMLKNCFGEDYTLSEGVEKEETFFNEYENTDIVTHYTEWTLSYPSANGQECAFVFNNRNGKSPDKEHLEKAIDNYFSDLTEQFYKENFRDKTSAQITGLRAEDCALYIKPYRLFSVPDMPETSAMFDERLHYSLAEHIYFPELSYERIFSDFPYILNMYYYVTYENDEEQARSTQRQETENILREMTDEIIQYTDHSLNAAIYVTMMDENGFADNFSFSVLNGEYFAPGPGTEYEIALHENFFGPI